MFHPDRPNASEGVERSVTRRFNRFLDKLEMGTLSRSKRDGFLIYGIVTEIFRLVYPFELCA
jgi:hypothetical protein